MLANALEARAFEETLLNEAIRKATHEIDEWREAQRAACISYLTATITSSTPDPETLTHQVGNLDPEITTWVNNMRTALREAAIKTVNNEVIEDVIDPHATELFHVTWLARQSGIQANINEENAKLEQSLGFEAENKLEILSREINDKLADDVMKLRNAAKANIQTVKDELETHELSSVTRTAKPPKPSPLNITNSKKLKRKKCNVLDLTTPSPSSEVTHAETDSEMITDNDSTPMTPIIRSLPLMPIERSSTTPPPARARTQSPEDKTPHAPTFPQKPAPIPPAPEPTSDLQLIMAAINGLKSELTAKIDAVNARVDSSTLLSSSHPFADYDSLCEPHPDPALEAEMNVAEDANLIQYTLTSTAGKYSKKLLMSL